MGFWCFMLLCLALVPGILLIAGRLMWKRPPGQINGLLGYRSGRSMKNDDTWRFAQTYCGRLWWRLGLWLLIPSLGLHLAVLGAGERTVGLLGSVLMACHCAVLLGSILPVELALKKNFHPDGRRRDPASEDPPSP